VITQPLAHWVPVTSSSTSDRIDKTSTCTH
jgi:hypothetical protein